MHSSTLADFEEFESYSSDSRASFDLRASSYRDSTVTAAASLPEASQFNCSLKSRSSSTKKRSRGGMDPGESIPMLKKQKSNIADRIPIPTVNSTDIPGSKEDATYTVLIKLEDSDGHQRRISDITEEPGPTVTIFENNQTQPQNSIQTGSDSQLQGSETGKRITSTLAPPGGGGAGDKNSLKRQRSMSDTSSLKDPQILELRKQWENESLANPNLNSNSSQKRPASTRFNQSHSRALLNSTGSNAASKKQRNQASREKSRKSSSKKSRTERKQESKAAKTLSAILLAFILTWTPYSIIIVIEAFKPGTIPTSLWNLSYYLCYINSTVNPLCYALCNATFRGSYFRIVTCKWRNPRSQQHRARGTTGTAHSGFLTRH